MSKIRAFLYICLALAAGYHFGHEYQRPIQLHLSIGAPPEAEAPERQLGTPTSLDGYKNADCLPPVKPAPRACFDDDDCYDGEAAEHTA